MPAVKSTNNDPHGSIPMKGNQQNLTGGKLTEKDLQHLIEHDNSCSWIAEIILERQESGLSSSTNAGRSPTSAD